MIAHGKDIKIFAGNSNPKLALDICKKLGTQLGNAEVGTFSDGEKSVSRRVSHSDRGRYARAGEIHRSGSSGPGR